MRRSPIPEEISRDIAKAREYLEKCVGVVGKKAAFERREYRRCINFCRDMVEILEDQTNEQD